jgi:hypothetical protein
LVRHHLCKERAENSDVPFINSEIPPQDVKINKPVNRSWIINRISVMLGLCNQNKMLKYRQFRNHSSPSTNLQLNISNSTQSVCIYMLTFIVAPISIAVKLPIIQALIASNCMDTYIHTYMRGGGQIHCIMCP